MAAVTPVGAGVYRVDEDGQQTIVYVVRSASEAWAFCNGEVYHERSADDARNARESGGSTPRHDAGRYELTAPMPATVVKLLAAVGQHVRQGETLVVLEAMKMELPVRAPADAVVQAIHCREGELVQPDRPLVELA